MTTIVNNSKTTINVDVVVVGGGCAGLSVAHFLSSSTTDGDDTAPTVVVLESKASVGGRVAMIELPIAGGAVSTPGTSSRSTISSPAVQSPEG